VLALGQRLYTDQCARCHGDNGEGAGAAYPPLKGNRTVTMDSSVNLVRVIVSGGFAPTTPGNPRPYGMPPFGQALSEAEIAAVASYVRSAWGNAAGVVQPLDVQKVR
jgi:mono/diheme cytochrome c family protein